MALSADTPRRYGGGVDPTFTSLPCVSAVTIYEGSAVGESTTTGTYRALVGADNFVGFAHENVVNPSGGTKRVKVRQKGIIRIPVTGATGATDNNATVYASADGTFSLTSTTTSTSIGKVVQYVGATDAAADSTMCDVYFEGAIVRSL